MAAVIAVVLHKRIKDAGGIQKYLELQRRRKEKARAAHPGHRQKLSARVIVELKRFDRHDFGKTGVLTPPELRRFLTEINDGRPLTREEVGFALHAVRGAGDAERFRARVTLPLLLVALRLRATAGLHVPSDVLRRVLTFLDPRDWDTLARGDCAACTRAFRAYAARRDAGVLAATLRKYGPADGGPPGDRRRAAQAERAPAEAAAALDRAGVARMLADLNDGNAVPARDVDRIIAAADRTGDGTLRATEVHAAIEAWLRVEEAADRKKRSCLLVLCCRS